jgi:hypothetical protein
MGETDTIIKDLSIVKKAQFNMIDLYKTLKAWFDLHEYDFYERQYDDMQKGDKKAVKIKWEGQKEVDDYHKFKVKLGISLGNYDIVETKKGKSVEGDLKIGFKAQIQSDYDSKWATNPFSRFFRGIFDKFIATSRREKYEKEITQDTHDIFNRTKTYLNLEKFN